MYEEWFRDSILLCSAGWPGAQRTPGWPPSSSSICWTGTQGVYHHTQYVMFFWYPSLLRENRWRLFSLFKLFVFLGFWKIFKYFSDFFCFAVLVFWIIYVFCLFMVDVKPLLSFETFLVVLVCVHSHELPLLCAGQRTVYLYLPSESWTPAQVIGLVASSVTLAWISYMSVVIHHWFIWFS